jgi:hypothetical protein
MKTFNDLAVELCKREGKKKQVNVAQMAEIVHCLCVLLSKKPLQTLLILVKRAEDIATKSKKKKK